MFKKQESRDLVSDLMIRVAKVAKDANSTRADVDQIFDEFDAEVKKRAQQIKIKGFKSLKFWGRVNFYIGTQQFACLMMSVLLPGSLFYSPIMYAGLMLFNYSVAIWILNKGIAKEKEYLFDILKEPKV